MIGCRGCFSGAFKIIILLLILSIIVMLVLGVIFAISMRALFEGLGDLSKSLSEYPTEKNYEISDSIVCNYKKGVLTIKGRGDMPEFYVDEIFEGDDEDKEECPWRRYADDIEKVVIEDGITSISDGAFYGLRYLEKVEIGKDVKYIGEYAFGECVYLTKVNFKGNVEEVSETAFNNCKRLGKLKMPNGETVTTSIEEKISFLFTDKKYLLGIV